MIKGAIFDMDGTLTDTERLFRDSWLELAKDYGQEPKLEFTRAVCGSNGQEMMNIISRYYPEIDARSFMDDCYAMVARKVEQRVPVKEGVREFLAFLRGKGLKMAVASSGFHAQIEKNMKKAGLDEFFDIYVGGDEVENSKPHPEIYCKAAKAMGLEAMECMAFEDGMNGLRSALAAKCQVYMMVDLTMPDDEVAPQCEAVYESFSQALEAFRKK